MDKELEEAIKQLEDLKDDRESFLTGDKEHDKIYLKDIEAIKTALKELKRLQEDYIPKDKIREKIQELQEEYEKALEENSTKTFILKCQIEILKELMEGK